MNRMNLGYPPKCSVVSVVRLKLTQCRVQFLGKNGGYITVCITYNVKTGFPAVDLVHPEARTTTISNWLRVQTHTHNLTLVWL